MAFVKGMQKVAGSGRKPGSGSKRRLYEMVDTGEFRLMEHLRNSIAAGDSKMVSAIASLLTSLSRFPIEGGIQPISQDKSLPQLPDNLTEEQLKALLAEAKGGEQ